MFDDILACTKITTITEQLK